MFVRRYLRPALLMLALALALALGDRMAARSTQAEPRPLLKPPGGAYRNTFLLTVHPARPGDPLVFTTDGSLPTATDGTLYRRPLRLDGDRPGVVVFRVREFTAAGPGLLCTASYAVGPLPPLPVLSIAAAPADLLALPRTGREITAHVSLIEGEGPAAFALPVGLRLETGGMAATDDKPTFRLAFRREYGASRLEYPLFPNRSGDEPTYKRLLLVPWGWTGRRATLEGALSSALAAEMGLPTARGKFVLLFLNGEPQGIYYLRERVDRFYLRARLGVSDGDLVEDGRALIGDERAWEELWAGVGSRGLDGLEGDVDLDGLMDVVLLQAYFDRHTLLAVHDRDDGRWLWVYPPERAGDPSAPTLLSRLQARLLDDEEFRARYPTRAADRLNTVLAPAAVEEQVERLAAVLRPAISFEVSRHPPGTPPAVTVVRPVEEWERDVAALLEFVRRRPEELRRRLAAGLELGDTAVLTFGVAPTNGGSLLVNGQAVPVPSWQGRYFPGTRVRVVAVPAPGYVFAGWEGTDRRRPTLTVTVDGPCTVVARFVPGGEGAVRPNDVIINEYWIDDDGTRYGSLGGRGIVGDWVELRVMRSGVDLRGWRLTDNDTKTATDEGSLIFPPLDALAAVPRGTVILIIATENVTNALTFPTDDLNPADRRMVFYVGNGHLDTSTDPGFDIGRRDEALVLLAPGLGPGFADDVGVDFVAEGEAATVESFGVPGDGVRFAAPFRGLGRDDGAVFTGRGSNDDGRVGWVVDPPAEQSGDVVRPGTFNILSPGAPNEGQ